MPRCLVPADHLTVAELDARYRAARDPVERTRWQAIRLVARGRACAEAAEIVGYSVDWVRTLIRRYNAGGPDAVGDGRRARQPRPRRRAVDRPQGGRLDRAAPRPPGRRAARLGLPAPARLHAPAPPSARRPRGPGRPGGLPKGGLTRELARIRRAHPGARLTVWAEDEHRLGLLPVQRRVWAPRGQRPVARVRRRYRWLYVYGFVRPRTGQTWWCLLPTVRAEAFALALAEFARDEGIDAANRAVLVLDRAGWHTADLALPEGIDLVFLPPYSPELQPAERLWPLLDEPAANRAFADLDELADAVAARCLGLRADRDRLQGHTCFHWWPPELQASTK